MNIKKGNIVYLKDLKINGCIQSSKRPFLVVSNDYGNLYANIVTVVPLTSKLKRLSQPTHVVIPFHNSVALCEQIITINKSDIISMNKYVLNKHHMKHVDFCLKIALGIDI